MSVFIDTFTDTSGTLLDAHTPDVGTGYTKLINVGTGDLTISGNQQSGNSGGYSTDEGGLYTADATYSSADYVVQTVYATSASNSAVIIAARVQDADNMYALRWGENAFRLYKKVSGTWTELGSDQGAVAVSLDLIRLKVEGTSIRTYVNGTLKHDVTDSAHSSAGKAGIGAGAVVLSTDDASNTNLDDFAVITLAEFTAADSRTTIFNDTFTEASATDLDAHTPDTGTSWSLVWQTASTTKAVIDATNDRLQQDAGGSANTGALYAANASYPSADYSVQFRNITVSSAASTSWWATLRMTDADNFYVFTERGLTGATTANIKKKVAGTGATLGASFNLPGRGTNVRFEATGTALKVFYNDAEMASRTDSEITATGTAGIGMAGGGESPSNANDDPNSSMDIDDFKVTTATAGGGASTTQFLMLLGVGT